MPATSVRARPSITSVGTLPSGLMARNSGDRISLRASESGRLSNGTPISWSAICGAIELEPGEKYSVSMADLFDHHSAVALVLLAHDAGSTNPCDGGPDEPRGRTRPHRD